MLSELFSAVTEEKADIDRPIDELLGSDADAIFECNSNRFVDDDIDDRCFVVVAKAHDDCDDVIIKGSLPIRSLRDDDAGDSGDRR